MKTRINIIVLLLLVIIFVQPDPVYAYVDLGTGSYVTQVFIGLVLGGGALSIGKYWGKIKKFIFKLLKNNHESKKKNSSGT